MNIKPIRNDEDYEAALHRIESLMDAKLNTPEGDELDILSTLVDDYESKLYPINAPDPIEYIKNVLEFRGEKQSDLSNILKSKSRASEIIKRRRSITLTQIRKIVSAWDIPADPLVKEYRLVTKGRSPRSLIENYASKAASKKRGLSKFKKQA